MAIEAAVHELVPLVGPGRRAAWAGMGNHYRHIAEEVKETVQN
jgi:hypothetical protein